MLIQLNFDKHLGKGSSVIVDAEFRFHVYNNEEQFSGWIPNAYINLVKELVNGNKYLMFQHVFSTSSQKITWKYDSLKAWDFTDWII